MPDNDILKQLRCPHCNDRRIVGPEEMIEALRAVGKLRREAKPDWGMLLALFENEVATMRCKGCTMTGLILEAARDDFDFQDSKSCEVCGQMIPAERLEIFPDVTRCAACQDKPTANADDYCSHCGGIVQVRTHGGAGVSRYVAVCSDCGLRQ